MNLSPVQIQNWTIIYHGTEHFVSHHFSSLETTHYAFSSSAFARLQRLAFSQGDYWCAEPSPKHIYTAETPPRASKKENFSPVTELKYLNICILRFVPGNACQQLSVTTRCCSCFRGDKSWENDGLLLGSLKKRRFSVSVASNTGRYYASTKWDDIDGGN